MPLSVAPPIFTMGHPDRATQSKAQSNEKDGTIVSEESVGASSSRLVADAGKVKVCSPRKFDETRDTHVP